MKVLLAHDYYQSSAPSGEDAVFRNERALLEDSGVQLIPFERFNDDIDNSTMGSRIRVATDSAWSRRTYGQISDVLRRNRPDIAHFHNTFPLISPSAYAACQDNHVPVVQTLHNYRLICPGGLLLRDGSACEDCVGTSLLPALRHRCYRTSFLATGAVVWMLAANRWRGTYRRLVNRYIVPSAFAAGRLIAGGLPKERITVKPHFVPNTPSAGTGDEGYAVYVGRLSEEKGVRTLLAAWRHVGGLALKIIGDGELRAELERQAERDGLSIEFLGFREYHDVARVVRNAAMQIVPSECYETFGMVVIEAYAHATPVIVSRIGSLEEIVRDGQTGLLFEAGNPMDLADKVNQLKDDRLRLADLRYNARAAFEGKYTAELNYGMLMKIYKAAIDDYKINTGKDKKI